MVIKLSLSTEEYQELEAKAKEEKMILQDYIRAKLLSKKILSFDPEDAYNLALSKFKKNDTFSLPDVYGSIWQKLIEQNPNMAGVYGKKFDQYVETKTGLMCVDKTGRRAIYKKMCD